jgi:hypothetical protein
MKNKNKKKVIKKLKKIIKANKEFCERNGFTPSEYILGVNEASKMMIKYIKKLK